MSDLGFNNTNVKFLLCLLAISGILLLTRYWINNPCLTILVESHCTLNTTEPFVLLSFDDGPHPQNTPAILNMLKKHGIFALFFVNRNKIIAHKEIAKRVVEQGHQLANHSFAHDELIFKSYDAIESDLLKTDSLILDAGEEKLNYFRAPYGKSFINLPRVLKHQNKQIIGWSIAPPAQFDENYDPQKVRDQILDQLHPGAIILLHDGVDNVSAEQLSELVEELIVEVEKRGYRFIKKEDDL